MCCGHTVPLLAIVVYREPPVVSVSAVGVRSLLPLAICAGTVELGCTSNVWLTVDTLSARVVEPDGSWPREMKASVTWMVVSAGFFPVAKHRWSWDALTRAIEIKVAGS